MPATIPRRLVDATLDAIEQSGYSAVLLGAVQEHPRKFALSSSNGESFVLWVYAWTLTPGGRPSLPDEYRIQMTTVTSPLALNPKGPTVLIGYEPGLGMFGGFDILRHRRFTSGSPSVQIDLRKVREAITTGLAFDRKDNDEIAVGVRPDQFVNYAINSEHLHAYGAQPETFKLLARAARLEPISARDISDLAVEERRRIVQTVTRLSRDASFRQQVTYAYGHRCAVTGNQLRLVDAAHVLPVGAPKSVDAIVNGICLSPTYHRAFDNGLIYLDTEYVMHINKAKVRELTALKLAGGLNSFAAPLEKKIILPPDPKQWPRQDFIDQANRYRMTA